jgi:hypothetical protein
MKTLKSMLAGIVLLLVCAAANATAKPAVSKLTKDDVINIYVDAIAHGHLKGFDNVLDDSLHFDIKRGDKVDVLHKDQLLDYLGNSPIDPSVTTTSTTISDNNGTAVMEVVFKYAGYTRTDMVTLESEGGWMITKVESTYS